MPSARLYGRRWHFSTDIMAIPAGLSGLFHAAWIIILLVWAGATGSWPGHCTSHEGAQYAALFGGFLLTFALNLVIDLLLVWHSLQGAPFEASKRRWVEPLLYASTAPLGLQLGLVAWGAYVSTHLQPDCWPLDRRNAVTNLAQGLVFGTLGFLTVAAIGVAITYNAYPQHHDLSSWEARCECVAAMLCCHQNVVRRPDGKRPPLTNIAELTAGLLSHVDLDATDITAALFLASGAQNRRRRLRIAKALLPVYKAIRSGAAGSSAAASEEPLSSGEEDGDDAASTISSVNDVPTDAELDRMIAAQQARRLQQGRQAQHAQQQAVVDGTAAQGAEHGPGPLQQQEELPANMLKPGRRGKMVSWAEDAFLPDAATAAMKPTPGPSQPQGPPDLSGISLPALALRQLQREQGQGQQEGQEAGQAASSGAFGPSVPQALLTDVIEQAGSLPLTADNVARLGERMTAAEQLAAAQAGGAPPSSEQVQQAEQLLEELPASLPDQEVADQLAGAIEAEIRELGGGQLLEEAAALHLHQSESLDLAAIQIDPESPSIWFSTASSRAAAAEGLSSLASGVTGQSTAAAETEGAEEGAEHALVDGQGGAAEQSDELAEVSPFAAAGGATPPSRAAPSSTAATGAEGDAKSAPAVPPDPSEPIPPADEAAAAAVAEAAAASFAAAAADSGSPQARARKAASATGASSVGGASAAGGSVASSRLQLDKQLTLKYPTVITPSEHVDEFRGPMPAEALTDLYAGRHKRVPAAALREALHFLKYSYAVYSLQPKIEAPSSGVDVIFCCGCMASPIDPQKVVFQGLSELEGLEDEEAIELLHLNCSNRVLAHLPYMIALDHAKRAVVLAIRGTISAADIVTDAIVYPEPLDSWLPEDIKQELSEPAFAHAGMAAAAKAIFEDMTERGILQQLVRDEEVGDYVAPEQQEAQRGAGGGGGGEGGSGPARAARRQGQYDADAGRNDAGAERYRTSGAAAGAAGAAGSAGRASAAGQRTSSGTSAINQQSSQRGGPQGRLWEGTSGGAAHGDIEAAAPAGPGSEGTEGQPGAGFQHFSMKQRKRAGRGGKRSEEDGEGEMSPGRQVGEMMRRKIELEGWQLIVQGHSLGAGAAALVSLKLRESFPGLKCLAFGCPGGLVSKNLAHAMRRFTTCVVVGKDAVPRATVSNLSRLMDEMVTALARCKQPKLKVLLFPWWRHRKEQFRDLFWRYDEIPPEPLAVLQRYHESRTRIGQPLPMYPPGRIVFLRPIKTRQSKSWQAVWIDPEDIIAEGLLISPKMYRDHMCSTAYEALTAAAEAASQQEASSGVVDGSSGPAPGSPRAPAAAARGRQDERRRQRAARHRWQQRLAAQRSGSLQEVLVEAV